MERDKPSLWIETKRGPVKTVQLRSGPDDMLSRYSTPMQMDAYRYVSTDTGLCLYVWEDISTKVCKRPIYEQGHTATRCLRLSTSNSVCVQIHGVWLYACTIDTYADASGYICLCSRPGGPKDGGML